MIDRLKRLWHVLWRENRGDRSLRGGRSEHPLSPYRWITVRVECGEMIPWWAGTVRDDLCRRQMIAAPWGLNVILRAMGVVRVWVMRPDMWLMPHAESVERWKSRAAEAERRAEWAEQRADLAERRVRIMEQEREAEHV